uniref:Immunoglobulin V-set domain-containing protein n=1 Tax=Neolamprologus brichardi TaxID=32507 RepID=A0A3Q4GNY0_NEOBR
MKHRLLRLLIFLLYTQKHLCLIDAKDVTQTPMLWEQQGNNATMDCSHTKDASYFQMYWYRQLPGQNMELIGYPNPENDVKGKISFNGNARKHSNLTISNVSVTDSATLFFASSFDFRKRRMHYGTT